MDFRPNHRQAPEHPANRQAGFGWAGLAVAVALVAISRRSLWLDEAATVAQAVQPTLADWWRQLIQDKAANLQTPLYLLYIWGCEKLCGSGEWTLRLANLPWFVAGATAFITAFPRRDRRRPIAACVTLLCPFAWYYLDEVRPYAMQVGASLLVVASLVRLDRNSSMREARDTVDVALLLLGMVALSGSSLTGMIWAGAALLAMPALLSWPRFLGLVKRHVFLWLAAGGLLLFLGGYYLWTLTIGARASAVATTTVGSVLFIGYELLGFSGLGPGRFALRSAGAAALRPYVIALALYAAPTAILIGAALRPLLNKANRRHLVVLFCCGLPAAFLLAVGCFMHFRVLGRHFTPAVSVLLLLFTLGCSTLWSRRSAWARGMVLVFCALSLASCLSLRFLPRHERDNYRAAAAFAKSALRDGQSVWWNATQEGASYYGLPTATRPGNAGAALLVVNPARDTLPGLPTPQIIIASKPDLFDNQAALADYIRERGFQPATNFTAFVIWRRASP